MQVFSRWVRREEKVSRLKPAVTHHGYLLEGGYTHILIWIINSLWFCGCLKWAHSGLELPPFRKKKNGPG